MLTPEEILEREQAIVARSVGGWIEQVEEVKKAISIMIAEADTRDLEYLVPRIRYLINSLEVPQGMADEAYRGVLEAHQIGLQVASDSLGRDDLPNVAVSNNSKNAVSKIADDSLAALALTKENLDKGLIGKGAQSILTPLAPLFQNPAKVRGAVEWAFNNSVNSSISKVSLKMGEDLVVIPERDACVTCTAYAGVRSTKTGFPANLTYGKKPIKESGTIAHPPFHIHCRCIAEPGITDEYAEVLKREAVRSILRGYKLPSESEAIRIDAAKRLLDQDPVAPESVKKYASSAIKRGTYTKKPRKKK